MLTRVLALVVLAGAALLAGCEHNRYHDGYSLRGDYYDRDSYRGGNYGHQYYNRDGYYPYRHQGYYYRRY